MKTVAYMVHDAISNTEAQLDNFDPEFINQLAGNGLTFIAVGEDGSRSIAKPEEVNEPVTGTPQEFTFVMPEYVDTRLKAVADALDAVEALFDVKALAKLIKGDTTPLKTLSDKAEALRALLSEEEGDE